MEKIKNNLWTDTKGIANHFNLKPATIRKHRSNKTDNSLPFHKVGGNVRYNIIECEKFMDQQI
tara:strand:+ start:416 stop:604 length:189 start_codon:yes stop_codon:yes gene_type:complete